LRLGTRRSRLALAQAEEVVVGLARVRAGRGIEIDVEVVPIATSGDRGVPASAAPAGLKGLFVQEIVEALMEGRIDLAVHSAKDLPASDPAGVVIAAIPERADPRDVLVARVRELPAEATVGTSSLRRRAQLLRARPGARVIDLRGNVDTRLRRLDAGAVDALVLAAAGLGRLRAVPRHMVPFDVVDMVPAPGQGALAVQARGDDARTLQVLERFDHADSRAAFEAERALVLALGAGCASPLGAFAHTTPEGVALLAAVMRADGTGEIRAEARASTPAAVAAAVAASLLAEGAAALLSDVPGQ
jgi:hydroxymethylbilane synthase